MKQTVVSPVNTNPPLDNNASRPIEQKKNTHIPQAFESSFDHFPSQDPPLVPLPSIEQKNVRLIKVNDYSIPFSNRLGLKQFEQTLPAWSRRNQSQFRGEHHIEIPAAARAILQVISDKNTQPIRNGNKIFIFYKRIGLGPKFVELSPNKVLWELKEFRYVKVALAIFREGIETGFDSMLTLKILPQYNHRIDSLAALSRWWEEVGSRFILNQIGD